MKISNDSNTFIKNELKSEIKNYAVCAAILVFLGLFSLVCTVRSNITLIKVSAAVSIVTGLCVLVFGFIYYSKRQNALKNYIENFAFGVEDAAKAAVSSFPDPIVIISDDGIIEWYNKRFSVLCKRESLFGTDIHEIFPAIRLETFIEDKIPVQDFTYDGRDYILTGTVSETNSSEDKKRLIGISFEDISDITNLQKQVDDKKTVVCVAIIDNYDEVLKETPNSNHGVLVGDIERCISLWVDKGGGIYRRYERDKFVILFEAARFEVLYKEKFTILNDVKEINQQNKIPVTLSIGVSNAANDIKENDRIALSALDMALGRGGDQAVMKTENGYSFFGAKSLGVEKTTKVKARIVANRLCELIDKSSNVIIMGHKGADYDSFGAAVGLFHAVTDRNKKAYIAMDKVHNNIGGILPDILMHREYAEGIVGFDKASLAVEANTLIIIVDTHRESMVEYSDLLKYTDNIALIDHHRRSEDFMDNTILTYHEPYASSACEMVTEILQYMECSQELSVYEAEAMYCGIYMDTKAFRFKTGARTFEAAAYLRKAGVDPVRVHMLFRNDISMYIQKSKVISNAKIYRNNIAIAVCEEQSKNIQLVVAQAADDLLNIKGVEASFVLAAVGSKIIISGRSLGAVNVQVILEKLGGGGHITIAGAQLENNNLEIAEMKLHNAIDEALFE